MFLGRSISAAETPEVEQNLPLSDQIGWGWKEPSKRLRDRMTFVQVHKQIVSESPLRAGFLNLSATDILNQTVLCCGRLSSASWDV